MPFLSGKLTYIRLRVSGGSPAQVDDAFLGILKDHAFRESPAPRFGTPEIGFTTGVHLLDSQFSYEKNSYGQCAHFALRVDVHQVPAELKKAIVLINQQAAAAASASGFASKADKADAKDDAARAIEADLASGKYRKSKAVPILWDFASGLIYCANASDLVVESLAKMLREAFAVKVQVLTAGAAAAEMMSATGGSVRAFEDLRPSTFTAPPADMPVEEGQAPGLNMIPGVPWIAKARDLRDFLGNEFLMWLLWKSQEGAIETHERFGIGAVDVTPWEALDLQCAWGHTGKTALRRQGDECGSPLGLPECAKALASGKWPRKMGMMLSNRENGFELTLQGDQMQVSGGKLPGIEEVESERELADARLQLMADLEQTLQATYDAFLTLRVSAKWNAVVVPAIGKWIDSRNPDVDSALDRAFVNLAGDKDNLSQSAEIAGKLVDAHAACKRIMGDRWDATYQTLITEIKQECDRSGTSILSAALVLHKAKGEPCKPPYYLAAAYEYIDGADAPRSVTKTLEAAALAHSQGKSSGMPKIDKQLKKLGAIGRKDGGSCSVSFNGGPEIKL